jgi:hypothetical protein
MPKSDYSSLATKPNPHLYSTTPPKSATNSTHSTYPLLPTPSSTLDFISLYLSLHSTLYVEKFNLGNEGVVPSDALVIGGLPCKDSDGGHTNQVRLVYLPGAGEELAVLEGKACKEFDSAVESFLAVALEEGKRYTRRLIEGQGDE